MSEKVLSADCEIILKRFLGDDNFELIGYSHRPLSDNVEGFMGHHLWLTIQYKREGKELEKTFFLKEEPTEFEMMLEFCTNCNAFNNETFFYEKLVPEFKKYNTCFDETLIPKFYLSKDSKLVVMENCGEDGYKNADTIDVLDMNHLKLLLQGLANLHTASIIFEERKSEELGRKYRLDEDYSEYLEDLFFHKSDSHLGFKFTVCSEKCIHLIMDHMSECDVPKEKLKQKFSEFNESSFELSKPSKQFRNVLCHADMWRKNILYKYENDLPVSCKMIDFQLIKYNPPIFDVLKSVYQCTSAKMRQHHLDDIINYYYNRLQKELKLGNICAEKVLPYDEIISSAKQLLPYILVEAIYYYTFQKIPPEYFKEIMADKDAYKDHVFSDRSEIVRRYYKPGTYFQIWMDELLFEVKDIISHDGFSKLDCYTMLKNKLNSTNYELIKYEINPVSEQHGFMGAHKKIKVSITRNNVQEELNFFAKFIPTNNFAHFAIESKFFDNEKFMYDHLFKKMAEFNINIYDCVAKSYFARRNDVIVFEDLNESGFQQIDKHKSLKYESLIVVIQALAKYHACCLIFEEKMSVITGKEFRICSDYAENLQDEFYVRKEGHISLKSIGALLKGVEAEIDIFSDPKSTISNEDFKEKSRKVYEELMPKLSEPSKKYRNVVCHGDLWASNILLKYENGEPVQARLVDFQCIKKCPPALDLMLLIHLTTSRKFRSNYMNEILDLYHEELSKNLLQYGYNIESIVPYHEFIESCELYKAFGIAHTLTLFPFIMANTKEMQELFTDNRLSHKTIFVDRSEYIIKMCNSNPQYKIVLNDSFKDFRMLCETVDL